MIPGAARCATGSAAIPCKVAMAISGHKTEGVYRPYDIVSSQDMRLAADKMEKYLDSFRASTRSELDDPENSTERPN